MRRYLVITFVALFAVASVVGTASTTEAATKDPCKVLTTKDIAKVFDGATVSKGKTGLKTAANEDCKYTVGASGALPEGDVIVIVMFAGAKAAYDGLKDLDGYEPVPELGKSIYHQQTSSVQTLKGDLLLGMQGLFTDGELPITYEDVLPQLIALSKKGLKKV